MANVKEETIKFTVVIEDPQTPAEMCSEIVFHLTGEFYKHPTQYGNGYGLAVTDPDKHFENIYDIRYDTSFKSNDKRGYLERWARGYWTGKKGAYRVKTITFNE